ncbi:MAG: prepilin-type N-terminal cleavage/methylation domain-containing protein, partial [bacterium]
MKKGYRLAGFTLIELLVVIAIIAILAAILFPVFARAREKARQTTCMSNQRQIIMSLSIYAQDHEETYPSASTIWRDINITTDALYCPTYGKKGYGYVYNSGMSNLAVGDVPAPDKMMATCDGTHAATTAPSVTYDNVAYSLTDFAFRHSSKLIATYVDGHVGLTDKVGATGSVLWLAGDSSVTISGPQVTSWSSTVGSLKLNASDTTSSIDFTTLNNHTSIKIAPRSSWGMAFCSPSMASLGIDDFTVFVVYQLPDPPGTNSNGVYIWNMNSQGSSWCAGVNSLYVS